MPFCTQTSRWRTVSDRSSLRCWNEMDASVVGRTGNCIVQILRKGVKALPPQQSRDPTSISCNLLSEATLQKSILNSIPTPPLHYSLRQGQPLVPLEGCRPVGMIPQLYLRCHSYYWYRNVTRSSKHVRQCSEGSAGTYIIRFWEVSISLYTWYPYDNNYTLQPPASTKRYQY